MGGFYRKISGTWVPIERPFLKQNNQWVGLTGVYERLGGVWQQVWSYSTTPPRPPSMRVFPQLAGDQNGTSSGQYLGLKVRNTGYQQTVPSPDGKSNPRNDPNLKMIRVLTTYAGAPPTTQYGGTYNAQADQAVPFESWSDYYYNSYGPTAGVPLDQTSPSVRPTNSEPNFHGTQPTSYVEGSFKFWPPSAPFSSQGYGQIFLPQGRYYFTAWAQDINGNWSEPNAQYMDVGTYSTFGSNFTRDMYIYPDDTGTYLTGTGTGPLGFGAGGTWTSGPMNAGYTGSFSTNPENRKHGYAFYGHKLVDTDGSGYADKNLQYRINTFEVQVTRSATDTGATTVPLWLGVSGSGNPNSVNAGAETGVGYNGEGAGDVIQAGTFAKGESKWVQLPTAWLTDNVMRGIKIWDRDPIVSNAGTSSTAQYVGIDTVAKAMQIHLNVALFERSGGQYQLPYK